MPDAEKRVIYRAIADFSSLAAEAAKARAELEALKEAEGKYNKASTEGVRGLEAAHKAKTAEISKERAEEEKARQSLAQHTAAVLADAKAIEQQAKAEEKNVAAAKSRQGVSSGTSPFSAAEAEKRVNFAEKEANAAQKLAKAEQELAKRRKEKQAAPQFVGTSKEESAAREASGWQVESEAFEKHLAQLAATREETKKLEAEKDKLASATERETARLEKNKAALARVGLTLEDLSKAEKGLFAGVGGGAPVGQALSGLKLDPVDLVRRFATLMRDAAPKAAQGFESNFKPRLSQTPFSDWVEKAAVTVKERGEPLAKALAELLVPFGQVNLGQLPLAGERRAVISAGAKVQAKGDEAALKIQKDLEVASQRAAVASDRAVLAENRYTGALQKFGAESRITISTMTQFASALGTAEKASRDAEKIQGSLTAAQKDTAKAVKEAESAARTGGSVWQILGRELKNVGQTFKEAERGAVGAFREVDKGASIFTKLGAALGSTAKDAGGAEKGFSSVGGVIGSLGSVLDAAGGAFGSLIGSAAKALPMIVSLFVAMGPLVGLIGSLGAAVLGLGSGLGSLGGSIAALPGLLAAGVSAFGALFIAITPVVSAIKAFVAVSTAQKSAAIDPQAVAQQVQKVQALATANYNLTQSQENAGRAQVSLTATVLSAVRSYQDLQETVANAALTERGASLDLQQAELAYRIAMADPNKTLLDREQAALAVQEAQVKLNDTNKQAARNQQDLNLINQTGVMGTPAVVSAQDALESAIHAVTTAQQALVVAQKAAVQPASAVATAQTALNVALSKLSPSALAVVYAFRGFSGMWTNISKQVQESFFSKIVGQTGQLTGMIPVLTNLLTKAGDAIGGVVSKGIAMVSSGPWKADFATGAKANAVVITNLGTAGLSVVDAFKNIAIAAIPFTTWITQGIANAAAAFDKWSAKTRASGNLADFLKRLEPRLKTVGDIFKNILETIGRYGSAATSFNDWILNSLDKITKRWATAAEAAKQPGSSFKKTLDDMKPVLTALSGVVKALADGFAGLWGNPKNLSNATDALNLLSTKILPDIFSWLQGISNSKAFGDVLSALKQVFDAINTFWKSGGGGAVTLFFASIAGALTTIAALHLGPVFGVIAGGLGVLAALRFVGVFKLARFLKKLPGFLSAITGGKLDSLLNKIPGVDVSKQTPAEAAAAATSEAGTEFKTTVVSGAEQVVAIWKEGATAAAATQEEGAATAAATQEGGAVTAAGTTEAGAVTAAGTMGVEAAGLGAAETGLLAGGALATLMSTILPIALAAAALYFGVKDISKPVGDAIGKWLYDHGFGDHPKPDFTPQTQTFLNTPQGKAYLQWYEGGQHGPPPGVSPSPSAVPGSLYPHGVTTTTPVKAVAPRLPGTVYPTPGSLYPHGITTTTPVKAVANSFFGSVAAALTTAASNIPKPTAVSGWVKAFFNPIAGSLNVGQRSVPTSKTTSGWVGGVFQAMSGALKGARSSTPAPKEVRSWVTTLFGSINGLFVTATLTPAVIKAVRASAQSAVDGLQRMFATATIPPNVIKAVQAGVQSAINGLQNLFSSTPLVNPRAIPKAFAAGGSLPEGVSMVGEVGPEWAVKSGRGVHIIPMDTFSASAARRSAISSGASSVPGFAFGTDFGVALSRLPQFNPSIPAGSHLSSSHTKSESGINIDHLDIHNPKPELAGDSLYRNLQKIQYFAGRGDSRP